MKKTKAKTKNIACECWHEMLNIQIKKHLRAARNITIREVSYLIVIVLFYIIALLSATGFYTV